MNTTNEILSFQDWLWYEYSIDPDEWKHSDKKFKSGLRAEYDQYVKDMQSAE